MDAKPTPSLPQGTGALDLRNIDAAAFRVIVTECRCEVLRLYNLRLSSLEGLQALENLVDLSVEWATKLTSVAPVFSLVGLRRLEISDVPKLRNLEGIQTLVSLNALTLSGGVWKPLLVASLRPLVGMVNLTKLRLTNLRLQDDDITMLAELPRLTELQLSNQFERAQVAYLAKRLNERLVSPLTACSESSVQCEKCDAHQFMFTGRRMPFLCRACDANRFQKLSEEFEQLVKVA